jgi:hypothetical protein
VSPSRKREIAGNDAGSRTKFFLEFLSEPTHDVGEEITEYHIGIPNIHIPEILQPHLNPFHPEGVKARQCIRQRVYLKPECPDTIAPLRSVKNPPVPAPDINKKIDRRHRYMIEECPDPDAGGGVEHGALRDREYGNKGKGEEKFADNKNPHCGKKYYNPNWHISPFIMGAP